LRADDLEAGSCSCGCWRSLCFDPRWRERRRHCATENLGAPCRGLTRTNDARRRPGGHIRPPTRSVAGLLACAVNAEARAIPAPDTMRPQRRYACLGAQGAPRTTYVHANRKLSHEQAQSSSPQGEADCRQRAAGVVAVTTTRASRRTGHKPVAESSLISSRYASRGGRPTNTVTDTRSRSQCKLSIAFYTASGATKRLRGLQTPPRPPESRQ